MITEKLGVAALLRWSSPLCVLVFGACSGGFMLGEPGPTPRSAREAYEQELGARESAALLKAWRTAGERAISGSLPVSAPHEETVFFDRIEPGAIGYRLELAKGARLRVNIEVPELSGGGLFLELYELPKRGVAQLRPVAMSERGARSLEALVRGGRYLLRVQPELHRGGRYRISFDDGSPRTLAKAAPTAGAILFPVEGRDTRAVISVFGDPRDGGTRSHRGVDIQAPRGTPALAAADGVVGEVSEGAVGGKVVWLLAGSLGLTFYYAHLDEQLVRPGDRVRAGDPVGKVGNTGNARGSTPHLHFGVYRTGPGDIALDPMEYLRGGAVQLLGQEMETVETNLYALGSLARTRDAVSLRESPARDAKVVAKADRASLIRLVGATAAWYRVSLESGRSGFLPAGQIEIVAATH